MNIERLRVLFQYLEILAKLQDAGVTVYAEVDETIKVIKKELNI